MCVSSARAALLSRSSFLSVASAAALPLFAEPARALDTLQRVAGSDGASLVVPSGLTAANACGARLASASPFARARYAAIRALADSIGDPELRANVRSLLENPTPLHRKRFPSAQAQVAMRDRMARAGFVAAGAPVEGIFPPLGVVQPFWSAPGSAPDSHHAYPGGLCTHELFNATMGEAFARGYDTVYFGGAPQIDRDLAIGAALYHDIMKTIVFQYREDGGFSEELEIGATGGHHVLSGAEAIARGRDARFVVTLLCAHAAPSLGDEAKVVTWCRAAAMLAGVDPVDFGMLRVTADGFALAQLPSIESFANHLSDHDYVFTVHAGRTTRAALSALASQFAFAGSGETFEWWRLRICSQVPAEVLYHALTQGRGAFEALVKRADDASAGP